MLLLVLALAWMSGCASPKHNPSAVLHFDPRELPAPDPAGPTLKFSHSGGTVLDCPLADFMYLIPLVSPEPLSAIRSHGNTQRLRVVPTKRRVNEDSFLLEFDIEITGHGSLRNAIDHTPNIQRNADKIRTSGGIDRVLDSITLGSPGHGSAEIEGAISNGLATVTEVRFKFNAHGKSSPIDIGVGDLRVTNGVARLSNEHLARVNALSFRRGPEPRVGVSIGSIRRKDGGEGLWSKLAGLAVNIALKPVKVDPVGHEAMLNFGRQLAAGAATFTFPRAANLREPSNNSP